jgi:segregation and condensation protein B
MTERQITLNTKDATVVTRDVDGDEEELLKVPISSTSTDRDGDELSERGLQSIMDQVRSEGTPIFGNHGMDSAGPFGMGRYDWKDIIATAKDAEMDDDEVVWAYLKPNGAHYDGEGDLLVNYVDEEQAVGFSIGFRPTESEEKESGEGNYIYHDVDLMETSAVGIPSNPDGVASAVAKAAGESGYDIDEEMLAQALVSEMSDQRAVTKDMTDEDNESDEKSIDDVLNRLDVLEETVESRFADLEARMDDEDEDDDDDESDDDEEESGDSDGSSGDGDSDSDEDEEDDEDKSYTQEDVEELEAQLEDMKDALDDGEVESSETKVHSEPDDDAETNDASNDDGGWF